MAEEVSPPAPPEAASEQADALVAEEQFVPPETETDTLVAEEQLAEQEPASEQADDSAAEQETIEQESYYVQQIDAATGEVTFVKLEGEAAEGQAVFVVRELEPGSGQYFYVQLEEQIAAPELPPTPPAPPTETIPWYKAWLQSGKHSTTTSPVFLITNVGMGIALGLDGIADGIDSLLATEYDSVSVISETMLKFRGTANITAIRSSGFGFVLQHEYRLLPNLALMGRFSYSGIGLGMDIDVDYVDVDYSRCNRYNANGTCADFEETPGTDEFSVDFKYYNWSFELHSRYYPRAHNSFFLDGVIGFGGAGFSTKKVETISTGEYVTMNPDGTSFKVEPSRDIKVEHLNVPAKRGYMVIGPMIGWREVFGKNNRGFTWETSIGFLAGVGFDKPLADQIVDGNITLSELFDAAGEGTRETISDVLKGTFGLIENIAIVGGPRFRMTIGWTF